MQSYEKSSKIGDKFVTLHFKNDFYSYKWKTTKNSIFLIADICEWHVFGQRIHIVNVVRLEQ